MQATGFQSGKVDVHGQWNNLMHGAAPRPLGGGVPVRLMYIGASVTLGEHSDGERGYRKQVRDWIASLGNPVNCVGGVRSPSLSPLPPLVFSVLDKTRR